MPSYNYKCLGCKKEFVVFQNMNDKHLTCCKFCESNKIERLFKMKEFEKDYKNIHNLINDIKPSIFWILSPNPIL